MFGLTIVLQSEYGKMVVTAVLFLLTTVFSQAQISPLHRDSSKSDTLLQKESKVVFVIVDGISADMLETAHTSYLDSISKQGGYSRAFVGGAKNTYSETPTISAVGYNSLLTGTWVNKHNVYGNSIENPNYQYPTIFKILKTNFPDKKTAIFSTWIDNRTKLLGENLKQTGNFRTDYAFDGFELDTIRFPHDAEKLYIKHIDKTVAEEAARYILEEGPDLSWVYLEFTDDVGHQYGDGFQMKSAIAFEDMMVGKIWQAVVKRELAFNEEWLLLITTDHGRTKKNGKGHGGQSDRERSTWIVTNSRDTNTYFQNETPAIVDLMPTMIRFMKLKIEDNLTYEIDGVSILGKTDAFNLRAKKKGSSVVVSWQTPDRSEALAQILVATTNNFKSGSQDQYTVVGEVPLKHRTFTLPIIPDTPLMKIVLKSENTTLNTWFFTE